MIGGFDLHFPASGVARLFLGLSGLCTSLKKCQSDPLPIKKSYGLFDIML